MTTSTSTAPRSGRRWSGADRGPLLSTAFVLIAGLIIAGGSADSYFGSVVILALTYAIVTAGMAVQIGFSQQVVFSQSVFMGLGAYGVAVLNENAGWPSLLALFAITIASGGVAWVIGKAVSRASGLPWRWPRSCSRSSPSATSPTRTGSAARSAFAHRHAVAGRGVG